VLSVDIVCFCGEVDGLEFIVFRIAIDLCGAEIVAKLGKEGDVEGAHHFMVFVDQVVAVELQWGQQCISMVFAGILEEQFTM
jgi:hypothetical protein